MRTSDTLKELAPALVRVQAALPKVQKGGDNKFDHYKYATLENYLAAAMPILENWGFTLITSIPVADSLGERLTSGGKTEHAVRVGIIVTLLHTSGEWLEIDAWGDGQDRGDKGIYKACTGARKYGVACLLGMVTTDDPENTPKAEPKTRTAKPRAPAKPEQPVGTLDQLDAVIEKWTGFEKADIPDARRAYVKCHGITRLTQSLLSGLIDEATKASRDGVDFMAVVSGEGAST